MSTMGRVDRRAVVFWIAVAAAVLAAIVLADRGDSVTVESAPVAAEPSLLAPDAFVDTPPYEPDERFSIHSDRGIHAGVMAF